ncbi:MAG: histidyl-tRNA synthetase [Afipia broomeae]|jgi:histidyl-tRNA synthetase|nr:MAG: histidine--tRNA ligase [Bradyrhizobiaceae bacterium]
MSDKKPKKPQKLRARLPRGLVDRTPAEIAATRQMVETIREVYERYGFEPVETPAMEYTDALGKFLPDQDRPNEGVFSFQDDDEQWISLRYDLTAPLARYVAENFDTLPKPYRSYRNGYVYRNEKPGPGRFRQFMQFDADTVGSASPAADAEMCMMAADTMEALGIPRGQYVVKVNNRKVLDGVMESIGLGGDENAGKRLTVLRAIDKLDRLGIEGVQQLLGDGRKDESGDFTKGAGLNALQIDMLTIYFAPKWASTGDVLNLPIATPIDYDGAPDDGGETDRLWSSSVLDKLSEAFLDNETFQGGLSELKTISSFVGTAGYGDNRIQIDPTVVRGLEYYTGPVYEVELLLDTKDEKGRPVRFGSVGGGGRYDGLVSRFRGEPVPATGFSIGVSRLQAALTLLGKIDTTPEFGPVVVVVMDRNEIAQYQKFVATLRNAGIRAELYLGNPKNNLGVQFKYADRRNSPCVVIQGGDEKAKGEVQIKDLIIGAEIANASGDRDDYLQKQADAQFACKESDLVEAVRKVLTRHNVPWK